LAVWLANLTAQKLTVALDGLPKGEGRAAVIDAASFARVTTDPDALGALAQPLVGGQVVLDAYAVARVEAAPCDMGAEGIMLPMVGTVADARHILDSMKYTPDGKRGVALQVAHDRYYRPGTVAGKFAAANHTHHALLPD
jgi:hypothetical protein